MASSSSSSSSNDLSTYDIFLSHSGAQKGFVNGLQKTLPLIYIVFFDRDSGSLPPGFPFPPRIFEAAKTCKLAVVVVSQEFISSKWPMLELCTFVENSVQILPLFFNLKPNDLRKKEWVAKWEKYATEDSRINMLEWKKAVEKLRSINGLVFDPLEGEVVFTNIVVNTIERILPSKNLKVDNPERVARVLQQGNIDHSRAPSTLESHISLEALTYINEVADRGGSNEPILNKLVDLNVVQELVQLLRSVNENNTSPSFMRAACWALDNLMWKGGTLAKRRAADAGSMEVLVRMLDCEVTVDCAVYCLRNILADSSAKMKLEELNKERDM
ncbi:hypothetical protein GOP47_0006442, partial [Adiantum capillus-veneris]